MRPCSPDADGIHSYVPQNPARKSVPAHDATQPAPLGRAPSGSLTDAFPCSPVWVSIPASPLPVGTRSVAVRARSFPDSLPRGANISTVSWSTPADPPLACTRRNACRRLPALYTLSIKLNHCPPLTPCSRAVNIRSVQTSGSTQLHRARMSLACLVSADTAASSSSVLLSIPVFHFPASLGSTPITAPLRYADAVTPLPGLFPLEVSLIHVPALPAILSPTTCVAPASLSHATPQRTGLPLCRGLGCASGSQLTPAESSLSSYGLAVHSL
jgi:hypothetical protein